MSIVAPLQGHFDGGELSPLLYGRVDSDRYKGALALCKNWIATLQGGLPRRPGTMFIDAVKDSTKKTRVIPFKFSTTQAYMLEFGNNYVRIYANYGIVENMGSPVEIVTPYATADLALIKVTQSADVLYIAHPNHAPASISRFSATNWVYSKLAFIDGPYRAINTTTTQLTPSATTGTVTITSAFSGGAVSVTGASNNGAGLIRITAVNHGLATGANVFIASVGGTTEANGAWTINVIDVNTFDLTFGWATGLPSVFVHAYTSGGTVNDGSFAPIGILTSIRLEISSVWGWGIVQTVTNSFTITVLVMGAFGGTSATGSWRLGEWGQPYTDPNTGFVVANYPGAVGFHQDRLAFTGAPLNPQRIDASNTSDYLNFTPTLTDGTVTDANALNFSLNAEDVNLNQWLVSDEKGLLTGSTSAEWLMWPSLQSGALTPTNVYAVRTTRWGSAPIQGILVGKCTLHVARGARKLRELQFSFYVNGYTSTDLTELAQHITGSGVIDMAYTSIPVAPIVWLLRNDGTLIGMTYDRDPSQLRTGWHQHVLGGQSDAAGTQPIIESIAVIPSPDGTRDDLWMVVQRWIDGSVVRTIEVLTKIFEDIDLPQYAYHLDCGLTYDSPITVSAITTGASTVQVTATAHGLSTGNTVRFDNITGVLTAPGQASALNGLTFVITVIDSDNFTLNGVNGTTFTPFVIPTDSLVAPQTRKLVTTISGLSQFNGETLAVWADGLSQSSKVVSGGAITLDNPAAVVSVGYEYNSDGQQLRLEAGSRNGTSLGKTRRTHRVSVMVHRTQGLTMGPSFAQLDTFPMFDDGDTSTLFSGIRTKEFGSDYDFDNPVCFRVSGPQPCTMLAIMPQMETQDRA